MKASSIVDSPGVLVRTDISLTGAINQAFYNSSSGREIFTSSSYYGAKPDPLVPHNFSYEKKEFVIAEDSRTIGVQVATGKSLSQTWVGPACLRTNPNVAFTGVGAATDYNKVLERLNDKARGGVDLSVDLLQLGQVRKMTNLLDRARTLAQVLKSKSRPTLTKDAARAHLEFIYGWKPLASSIYGTAEILSQTALKGNSRYGGSVKRTDKVKISFLNCYDGSYTALNQEFDYVVRDRVSVLLTAEDPQSLNKFTSLNPVSIAWELMPYSFVVDWVYDIGGYLRSMETAMLYSNRFLNGYKTNLHVCDAAIASSVTSRSSNGGINYTSVKKFSGYLKYRKLQRSVLASYPIPTLPRFEVDMGSSRVFAAASLLRVLLKR